MTRWFSKLQRTVSMLYCLFMARMFGTYEHSVSSDIEYAIYEWRGKRWAIPTSHITDDMEASQ